MNNGFSFLLSRRYNNFLTGDFILYQHTTLPFEVCHSSHPSLNDKEKPSNFEIDMCFAKKEQSAQDYNSSHSGTCKIRQV